MSPGFRFADYRDLFAQVRRAGLGVTVHAGETGGPEEVREAVEALEPTRIGHGISSTRDLRVMAMLRERGVVLEVCPSSNLHTRVVRSYAELRDDHARPGRQPGAVRPLDRWTGDAPLLPPRRDRDAAAQARSCPSKRWKRAIETARDASFVDRAPVPGGARR